MKKRLASERKFVDLLFSRGRLFSKKIGKIDPSTLIRLIRKQLRMTQRQLAKRATIGQSYLTKIELGKMKPSLEILEKLFRALGCDMQVIPVSNVSIDSILKKQALRAAEKRIRYIKGTMALEKQLPSEGGLEELIQQEQKRLLDSESSKIWDT